ncbi:MAG: hypothetical protein AT710_06775 [Thermocladium sp. ECH_B]|nr:MAG: hypothetical protein AT710_06775 [Thermocladium sp. ECH_B]
MSENNESRYIQSFVEGLAEPLVDLLIECLSLLITVINGALQQLTPSSQYTAQFTMLSPFLVVMPLALILIFAYIRPLIDWLDTLVYAIGLILGTAIFMYANISNAGLFSNIISNVTFNMLLILGLIMLGLVTRIYISLLKQERDYW